MGKAQRASSTTHINRDQLESVQGAFNFARRAPDEKAPEVVVSKYEKLPTVSYNVPVRNARPIVNELSLDREGFQIVQHKTAFANERDPEIMREGYLDEMASFIQSHLKAAWVVPVRQHLIVRSAQKSSIPGVRLAGAGLVHIDYAPISVPMAAAAECQIRGVPIRPYTRLMLIQAWRVLSPPPQDFPLAFCDASSVRESDVLSLDFVANARNLPGSAFKSCVVRYSPDQRWYYFPEMSPDEFILFKGYDSNSHYKIWTPHSGFDNRHTYPNAKYRESVEARFFVYFDDDDIHYGAPLDLAAAGRG